ncbi:MAG: hypothetical protein DI528_18600 [Shinella sp.]|nr:MAG: hypothetical protein DI528_18600 [Shinella sp.]
MYDLASLPELAPIMDRAREWLPAALRFEELNGDGSLLDVKHPRYVAISEKIALKMASKSEPAFH